MNNILLSTNILMLFATVIMIFAIIYAPLKAVENTNRLEDRRTKRNDKINLLKDLMAFRKNDRESRIQLARALNLVSVLFHDSEHITARYRVYCTDLLSRRNTKLLNDHFVLLVRDIASEIQYHIDTIDIDRCVGHEDLTFHDFQMS